MPTPQRPAHGSMDDAIGAAMNAADAVLSPTAVDAHPDRPALLCHDQTTSYRALLAHVNRFGNGLRRRGVAPEQRVILMLKDSIDLVAAYLGAIKIGAVSVALNLRSSAAELKFMLTDSAAAVLLIDAEFLPLYESIAADLPRPPNVFVAGSTLHGLIADSSEQLSAYLTSPDAMAFWIYTSGTTGTPKAAVHPHHDVLTATDYTEGVLGVGPDDRLFATSKLFFAYSLGNCLFASLRLGATTILHDGWPDSESIARIVDRQYPTVVFSVPTMYRNMLRDGIANRDRFASVRRFVSAGERLPANLFERWMEATGGEILDGMGTSETIYMILSNLPGRARPGSSGQPAPGVCAELRDETGTIITGADHAGVLWASMPSIADRYWNQQERSQAAFIGRWFRTGDMYRVDSDGFWHHAGRADDMLKISGQWVSPAEIEEQALKMAGIADAALVGAENADGLTRLALFAVASPGGGPDIASIGEALRQSLSIYKCPRDIYFVDEIPRTATGKVQRFLLRQRANGKGRIE